MEDVSLSSTMTMNNESWSSSSPPMTMDPFNDSSPSVSVVLGNCTNPLDLVDWWQPGLIISLVILGCVNVLVLLGNCLVVLAVFLDSKLRTVTNLFIVSLAMADLSVGLAVLPFSASLEVLNLWIFGTVLRPARLSLYARHIFTQRRWAPPHPQARFGAPSGWPWTSGCARRASSTCAPSAWIGTWP